MGCVQSRDDYINSIPAPPTPDAPFNRRSNAYNTISDRLMENDLMLDRALELIQKAVAAITEKMPAQTRAMYITTLGQVYYQRKEFDKAEEALKKAMATGGDDGSGEAQLYLGKIYDSKGENDAALDAYFKAATMLNNADLKSSLEKAYLEKYEKDQADRRPGFKFQEKLINVDGRQLIAVAFVQNDETREILQASFAR